MDITEILTFVFGGTSLVTLIEVVRYRKQDKRQREAEAKIKEREADDAGTSAQAKQIDLADKYFDGMLAMMEKLRDSQERGTLNQDKMLDMLNVIDRRIDNMELRIGDMEAYLNGKYHAFLAEKAAEKANKKQNKNSKNQQNEEIG